MNEHFKFALLCQTEAHDVAGTQVFKESTLVLSSSVVPVQSSRSFLCSNGRKNVQCARCWIRGPCCGWFWCGRSGCWLRRQGACRSWRLWSPSSRWWVWGACCRWLRRSRSGCWLRRQSACRRWRFRCPCCWRLRCCCSRCRVRRQSACCRWWLRRSCGRWLRGSPARHGRPGRPPHAAAGD